MCTPSSRQPVLDEVVLRRLGAASPRSGRKPWRGGIASHDRTPLTFPRCSDTCTTLVPHSKANFEQVQPSGWNGPGRVRFFTGRPSPGGRGQRDFQGRVPMSLREFFELHREELLRACQSDSSGEAGIEELAREVCALLQGTRTIGQPARKLDGETLCGDDPSIRRVRASIEQLARRSRVPVLFLGEVGTGKRRSARLLHACTYPDGEFFELESEEQLPLLERKLSALRVPSSAQAIGGLSVYVNELGETSRATQAALAKQSREHGVQCRLMASSQRPLAHACREGRLRSDLVFDFLTTVELPNLRERLTDLPALLEHVASRTGAPLVFSDAALLALMGHVWPGNLLELSHLVRRLQRLEGVDTIEPEHLTELGQRGSGTVITLPSGGIDLAEVERQLLRQALQMADNNRTRAARLLGLTRDQIRYRLSKLELPPAAPALRARKSS